MSTIKNFSFLTEVVEAAELLLDGTTAEGEYIALTIKDDSMAPKIEDGDVVIVRCQSNVQTGDIVIAVYGDGDITCRKFERTERGVILTPVNIKYRSTYYVESEASKAPVRIFGKVVGLKRSLCRMDGPVHTNSTLPVRRICFV